MSIHSRLDSGALKVGCLVQYMLHDLCAVSWGAQTVSIRQI